MDYALAAGLGVAAYLLGSIPPAYILVRLVKGVDIRRVGSRNAGALNTAKQVGAWGGGVVRAADAAKGALAVLLPGWAGAPAWTVLVAGVLVVAGHNWPVFLGFRGGKGAATIMGVGLAVVPVLTLIALAPAALLALLARNVIIGAAVGFIILDALVIATGQGPDTVALALLLTFIVAATYVAATWGQIASAIRTRRWRGAFYGPAEQEESRGAGGRA